MKSGILRGGLRLLCRPPQRMMCSLSPSSQQLATSIEDSVLKSLEALQVRPDSGILLCVSGGSDSMALLHIMQRIKERHWPMLQLKALTVNHLQRPEAFEEVPAAFVLLSDVRFGRSYMSTEHDLPRLEWETV